MIVHQNCDFTKFLKAFREDKEKKKLACSYIMNTLTMKRKKLEIDLLTYRSATSTALNSNSNQKQGQVKYEPFFVTKYSMAKPKNAELLNSLVLYNAKRRVKGYNRGDGEEGKKIAFFSISRLPTIPRDNSRYSFIHSSYKNNKENKL